MTNKYTLANVRVLVAKGVIYVPDDSKLEGILRRSFQVWRFDPDRGMDQARDWDEDTMIDQFLTERHGAEPVTVDLPVFDPNEVPPTFPDGTSQLDY